MLTRATGKDDIGFTLNLGKPSLTSYSCFFWNVFCVRVAALQGLVVGNDYFNIRYMQPIFGPFHDQRKLKGLILSARRQDRAHDGTAENVFKLWNQM